MDEWVDIRTGKQHSITSWKNENDPSPGDFTLVIFNAQIPQSFILNGSVRYWRSGEWDGTRYIGVPTMNSTYFDGMLRRMKWKADNEEWKVLWNAPRSPCDVYGHCGPFGSCDNLHSPMCTCLRGFEPKFLEEWNNGNWSGGCIRKSKLECQGRNTSLDEQMGDGFAPLKAMKLPDFSYHLNAQDVKQCHSICFENCTCIAYAYVNLIGCLIWGGELIDVQKFSFGGEELFLRLALQEFDEHKNTKVIIFVSVIGVLGIVACTCILWRWMIRQRGKRKKSMEILPVVVKDDTKESSELTELGGSRELAVFSLNKLAIATNKFHVANKLGQGGFGSVYKGILLDGQEIAVKRLSKSSGQGLEEFKNEVLVISKLQHRNLVRLLGCCIEGEEKMLIYEFLPNRSLDAFLFDSTKKVSLDWRKRFRIIEGIGRGILYLDRDSRLRVIHRDLKASNILLDQDLNPKISDFGMARIFGGNDLQANTRRVVGTYGYMSPEYAMEGLFSEKSDVFSFGVMLLKIISGKRNSSFCHHEESWSLLDLRG